MFATMALVPDQEKYSHLTSLRAKSLGVEADQLITSDYFPAYRATPVEALLRSGAFVLAVRVTAAR